MGPNDIPPRARASDRPGLPSSTPGSPEGRLPAEPPPAASASSRHLRRPSRTAARHSKGRGVHDPAADADTSGDHVAAVEDPPADQEPTDGAAPGGPDGGAQAGGRPEAAVGAHPEIGPAMVQPGGPSIWFVLAGIAASTLTAAFLSARLGALALVAVLVVAAIVRIVWPDPGPVGLAVRSRPLDAIFLLVPAVAIAALALFSPGV